MFGGLKKMPENTVQLLNSKTLLCESFKTEEFKF